MAQAAERHVKLGYLAPFLPLQSSKMNMSPMRHRILDGRSHAEVGRFGHREPQLCPQFPGMMGTPVPPRGE